jgi:hypothetical protein
MSHAAQIARSQRADAVARRRRDESLCAWDFLTWGDTRGAHANICIRPAGLVCSRAYNPGPPPEDIKLYEGSALGALWGLPGSPPVLDSSWPGWNLTKRRDTA